LKSFNNILFDIQNAKSFIFYLVIFILSDEHSISFIIKWRISFYLISAENIKGCGD